MNLKYSLIINALTFYSICSLSLEPELLKVQFDREYSDYETTIKMGTPSCYSYTSIDITTNFTWTLPFMYSYAKSQTAQTINHNSKLYFDNLSISSIEVVDIVQIDKRLEVSLDHFSFYIVQDVWSNFKNIGGIGLAYKFTNETYSLIHELKQQGLILSLSFSFVHLDLRQGYLYLGGIPNEIISSKYSSECKVNDDSSGKWSCALVQISFNNFTYVNTHKSYFDSTSRFIFAPKAFFNRLYEKYLDEAFKKNQCSFLIDVEIEYMAMCDLNSIDSFGNITFVIDSYYYSLSSHQLFNCNNWKCYFSILPNPFKTESEPGWIFGLQFLDQYDLLFDYQSESIKFYSNYKINKVVGNASENKTIKGIMIITLICILLFGLLFEIYQVYYSRGQAIKS